MCPDTLLCLPLCPRLLSLSDGWQLLPMFSAFGLSLYICFSLSIWLTAIFCFLPSPMSLINRVLSVGSCAHTLIICLIHLPVPPQNLGPSILAGVALMVLLIPLNGAVAMKMRAFQVRALVGLYLLPQANGRCLGGNPH